MFKWKYLRRQEMSILTWKLFKLVVLQNLFICLIILWYSNPTQCLALHDQVLWTHYRLNRSVINWRMINILRSVYNSAKACVKHSGTLDRVKHCMTVLRVRSILLEGLVTFWNDFAQMLSTMRRCAECNFVQVNFKVKAIFYGQTHFVSTLYLLNPWWDSKITVHKFQV